MKHQPVNFKEPWSKDRVEQQIALVEGELILLSKDITKLSDNIHKLVEERLIIQRKHGNKHKYLNQLKKQLNDL